MDRQLLWLNVGLVAYILPFLSCLFHSVVVTYLLYHNNEMIKLRFCCDFPRLLCIGMILVVAIGFTFFPVEYLSHYRRFASFPNISFAADHSFS